MKIGSWFDVEIERVESASELEEKLKEVSEEEIGVTRKEAILTGIADLSIDYNKGIIRAKTVPALFPLNKKLNERFNNKYVHPLLSVLTHAYIGPFTDPEYVILQKRSKKSTSQGHSEIQPAAAGFIEFNEQPHITALREFNEETGILENEAVLIEKDGAGQLSGAGRRAKCLDLTVHDIAYKGIKNPLLSYVICVKKEAAENKRVIKNLEELDSKYDSGVGEAAEIVKVSYSNLNNFYAEVLKADRQFGSTFQSMQSFMDMFSKK